MMAQNTDGKIYAVWVLCSETVIRPFPPMKKGDLHGRKRPYVFGGAGEEKMDEREAGSRTDEEQRLCSTQNLGLQS